MQKDIESVLKTCPDMVTYTDMINVIQELHFIKHRENKRDGKEDALILEMWGKLSSSQDNALKECLADFLFAILGCSSNAKQDEKNKGKGSNFLSPKDRSYIQQKYSLFRTNKISAAMKRAKDQSDDESGVDQSCSSPKCRYSQISHTETFNFMPKLCDNSTRIVESMKKKITDAGERNRAHYIPVMANSCSSPTFINPTGGQKINREKKINPKPVPTL